MTAMIDSVANTAAAALRPVAHWVSEIDEAGCCRLVMRWQVPDVDRAFRDQVAGAR